MVMFPYSGSKFKIQDGTPLSVKSSFSRRDIVLVADTSFLTALSNNHLWAVYSHLMVRNIADINGKTPIIFVPALVMDEYGRFQIEGSFDDYDIPLAHETLEKLLGRIENSPYFPQRSLNEASSLALGAWRESYAAWRESYALSNRHNSKWRAGPPKSDVSVYAHAVAIAEQGAEVYVASSDLNHIIKPLKRRALEFKRTGLRIFPLHPSEIELRYFKNTEFTVKAVISDEVVRDLQFLVESEDSYPAVVFERSITSGDAVFDACVGVIQVKSGEPPVPPQSYYPDPANSSKRPDFGIARVAKVSGPRKHFLTQPTVIKALQNNNSTGLVVFNYANPYFPDLFLPLTPASSAWQQLFRVSLDFLRHQTDSAYALANYKPRYMVNSSR